MDDPKSFMHVRHIPSSSGKRTEPISELLPSRELNCSLSSITLTVYNNCLEELTKSKASMTYHPQSIISHHKNKQTTKNPLCIHTKENNSFSRRKKTNGYYQFQNSCNYASGHKEKYHQ